MPVNIYCNFANELVSVETIYRSNMDLAFLKVIWQNLQYLNLHSQCPSVVNLQILIIQPLP